MPAASCRIMPARSINRCDTISASFGVSRRIGRKKRERRIGGRPTIREVYRESPREKPDRRPKDKGDNTFPGRHDGVAQARESRVGGPPTALKPPLWRRVRVTAAACSLIWKGEIG